MAGADRAGAAAVGNDKMGMVAGGMGAEGKEGVAAPAVAGPTSPVSSALDTRGFVGGGVDASTESRQQSQMQTEGLRGGRTLTQLCTTTVAAEAEIVYPQGRAEQSNQLVLSSLLQATHTASTATQSKPESKPIVATQTAPEQTQPPLSSPKQTPMLSPQQQQAPSTPIPGTLDILAEMEKLLDDPQGSFPHSGLGSLTKFGAPASPGGWGSQEKSVQRSNVPVNTSSNSVQGGSGGPVEFGELVNEAPTTPTVAAAITSPAHSHPTTPAASTPTASSPPTPLFSLRPTSTTSSNWSVAVQLRPTPNKQALAAAEAERQRKADALKAAQRSADQSGSRLMTPLERAWWKVGACCGDNVT